jgi:chromosome segregation ATPase
MSAPEDRTASLMTPAKLAQVGAARAPVTPSAYLDQMAADVGHQHVGRLSELRADLERQAGASQAATIQPALQAFAQALPQLDFGLLQARGFWAGVTGKSRTAGAEFAAQVAQLESAARALAAAVPSVQKDQQPHAAAADRTLLEFEVEYKALDRVIDQGARWLQDMRNQLKAREAQAGADLVAQTKLREDAARCEVLVMRLKALRAAAAASQQAHQQAAATAQRRAGLMQSIQKVLAADVKPWQSSLSRLAAAASEGKTAGLPTEGAREAHAELRQRIDRLLADCDQLRTDEQALLRQLGEMGRQLAAA